MDADDEERGLERVGGEERRGETSIVAAGGP